MANTSEQASVVKIVATAEKLLSGYDLHFGGPLIWLVL